MTNLTGVLAKRKALTKIVRNQLRLKHSMAYDAEVAVVLADVLDRFDEAMTNGEAFSFDPASLLEADV